MGLILAFAMLAAHPVAGSSDAPPAERLKPASQQALVRESLDGLIAAYADKRVRQFMDLVSESYVGDASILESAIRRDFTAFTNIAIRYSFNNVTYDGRGMISASITFTRDHTSIKSGKQGSIRKQTSMIFRREGGVYKLYSQKRPMLFGRR